MTTRKQTIWQGWIEESAPEHLRFSTEAEARAWMDQFLATDRRIWQAGDIRIVAETMTISPARKTGRGWNPNRPDADSTYWARHGYGDGDI